MWTPVFQFFLLTPTAMAAWSNWDSTKPSDLRPWIPVRATLSSEAGAAVSAKFVAEMKLHFQVRVEPTAIVRRDIRWQLFENGQEIQGVESFSATIGRRYRVVVRPQISLFLAQSIGGFTFVLASVALVVRLVRAYAG